MNQRKLIPALLTFLLVAMSVPTTAVDLDFVEDFEDDTVGQNPAGEYTYFESAAGPAVTASGHSGKGLSITASNYVAFQPDAGTNFCDAGSSLSVWFNPGPFTATGRELGIKVGAEDPNGDDIRDIDDQGMLGFGLFADFTSSWRASAVGYGASGAEVTTVATGLGYNQWYKVVIDNIDCSGKSVRVTLYNSAETQIGQATETCGSCTGFGTDFDTVSMGTVRQLTNDMAMRVDTINGGLPIPAAAPDGLTSTVTARDGDLETVEFTHTFPLSPDDPDQVTGDFTYKVERRLNGTGNWISNQVFPAGSAQDGIITESQSFTGLPTGQDDFWEFRAVAIEAGLDGVPSCVVSVDPDILFDSGSCGNITTPPNAPSGVSGFVERTAVGGFGEIKYQWKVSQGDPNPGQGSYVYEVHYNGNFAHTDTLTSDDGNGLRVYIDSNTVAAQSPLTIHIVAVDGGVPSAPSCSITLVLTDPSSVDSCGTEPLPSPGGVDPTPGGLGGGGGGGLVGDDPPPVFIQNFANNFGTALTAVIVIAALAVFGFYLMGAIGALAVGTVGLFLTVSWELTDPFLITALAIIVVGGMVFGFKMSRRGDE